MTKLGIVDSGTRAWQQFVKTFNRCPYPKSLKLEFGKTGGPQNRSSFSTIWISYAKHSALQIFPGKMSPIHKVWNWSRPCGGGPLHFSVSPIPWMRDLGIWGLGTRGLELDNLLSRTGNFMLLAIVSYFYINFKQEIFTKYCSVSF